MSHYPVNHPLRPFYRTLSGIIAAYLVLFGVVGLVMSAGDEFFHQGDVTALGLRTNLAFSLASIVVGAIVLGAVFVGRNLDQFVTYWAGIVFMTVGTAALLVIDSDSNVLNFSMATCIVSMVIGMVFFTAGLYGRSTRTSAA